jgi:hypothetical protein
LKPVIVRLVPSDVGMFSFRLAEITGASNVKKPRLVPTIAEIVTCDVAPVMEPTSDV